MWSGKPQFVSAAINIIACNVSKKIQKVFLFLR
uniref:Uncharacterized protein n=1 Tax=Arundo donax TaxID=35708 RepID=A0A0A9BHR0_ARUDO